MPYYNKDPKRDPNIDNHPYALIRGFSKVWMLPCMQHGPARADQPFHNSATGHASGWILQGHSHEVPEFYDKGTFFLRFGFDKGTLKQKGQKGTTQEPRTEHRLGCSPWKPHFRDGAPCRRGIGDQWQKARPVSTLAHRLTVIRTRVPGLASNVPG